VTTVPTTANTGPELAEGFSNVSATTNLVAAKRRLRDPLIPTKSRLHLGTYDVSSIFLRRIASSANGGNDVAVTRRGDYCNASSRLRLKELRLLVAREDLHRALCNVE
jgi:hypothetical protein